jgi:hypothetical protein
MLIDILIQTKYETSTFPRTIWLDKTSLSSMNHRTCINDSQFPTCFIYMNSTFIPSEILKRL